MIDRLLTSAQVAEFLGVTEATLYRWRLRRKVLPFITIGENDIRYRESDIQAYLAARLTPVKAAV